MSTKPQKEAGGNLVVNHFLKSSGEPAYLNDPDINVMAMSFRKLAVDCSPDHEEPVTPDGKRSPRLPGHLTINTSRYQRGREEESSNSPEMPSTPLQANLKGKKKQDISPPNDHETSSLSGPRVSNSSRAGTRKPALLRTLGAFCHNTAPEGTLLQLASILDETPPNEDLSSVLRGVIPLVIGDYIKNGADVDALMVQLETIIRSNKPVLENSPPASDLGYRRTIPSPTDYQNTSHGARTSSGVNRGSRDPSLQVVGNNPAHLRASYNDPDTHNRRRESEAPRDHQSSVSQSSKVDNVPRNESSQHIYYRHPTKENDRERDDQINYNRRSSYNTARLDVRRDERLEELGGDHRASMPALAQLDGHQIPHNRTPSPDVHLAHDRRQSDVSPNRDRQSSIPQSANNGNAHHDSRQGLYNSTLLPDIHDGRHQDSVNHDHDRQTSIPPTVDDNVMRHHRSHSPHPLNAPHGDMNPGPRNPVPNHSNRGSYTMPSGTKHRTAHFEEGHQGMANPEPRSTHGEVEGARTMEYGPILDLLKQTCRDSVKEETLEHYIQVVTHSPMRAQADKLALELDVTIATQKYIVTDLLVPAKPFIKHVVNLLFHRGQSGLTSKDVNAIEEELAAACSGTPYQVINTAAILLAHTPNDEELSKSIQGVILGLFSRHLIISRDILIEKILQLKSFPSERSTSQVGPSTSSGAPPAWASPPESISSRIPKKGNISSRASRSQTPDPNSEVMDENSSSVNLLANHRDPLFPRKRLEGAKRVATDLWLVKEMPVYRKERAIRSVATHKTVWYMSASKVSLAEPALLSTLPGEIYSHLNTTTITVQVWMVSKDHEWEDITEGFFGLSGEIVHPELTPTRFLGIRGLSNEPSWVLEGSYNKRNKN